MDSPIKIELEKLRQAGLERRLLTVAGPVGPKGIIAERETLVFCSNDYLGLANDPEIKKAAIEAVEKFGIGSGASRLVSGTMELHERLEARIARFMDAPFDHSALLFNSGYHANLACISALANRSTEIFSDRLNHASIVDACVLSRARVRRYSNRDAQALERLLRKSTVKDRLIITEGVFSMDGTLAPIGRIAELADRYNAMLLVDDAHAFGVIGPRGRGTLELFGVKRRESIMQIGTLGKAAGSFGAFCVAGSDVVRLLISKARPFIYTTALPPSTCAASIKALDIFDERPELREKLMRNVSLFKDGLRRLEIDFIDSNTQIIPIIIGDAQKAVGVSGALLERGVFIQAIRPPTVPQGTARLRVTLSAGHTDDDIAYALSCLEEVLKGGK